MKGQEVSKTDPGGVFPTTPLQAGLHTTTLQSVAKCPQPGFLNNADKKLHSRPHFTFLMSVWTEMRPNAQIKWMIQHHKAKRSASTIELVRRRASVSKANSSKLKRRIKHNIPGKELICKTNNIFKNIPPFLHECKRALVKFTTHH